MKRTYQPSELKRKRGHGFRRRMSTRAGRDIINRRRAKGRARLTVQWDVFFLREFCSLPSGLVLKSVVKTDSARFPKREHLGSEEFKRVFSRGRRFSDRLLTIYVLEGEKRKAGIVVRRNVRSAVGRNRLKRLLREIFRQNKSRLSGEVLLVVVVGREANEVGFRELRNSFLELMEKAGILSQ